MKVRTKSTEHEARQYAGTDEEKLAVMQWCGGREQLYSRYMILETRDGATRIVEDCDWIIEYPDGFEVSNPQEFQEVYEQV